MDRIPTVTRYSTSPLSSPAVPMARRAFPLGGCEQDDDETGDPRVRFDGVLSPLLEAAE